MAGGVTDVGLGSLRAMTATTGGEAGTARGSRDIVGIKRGVVVDIQFDAAPTADRSRSCLLWMNKAAWATSRWRVWSATT